MKDEDFNFWKTAKEVQEKVKTWPAWKRNIRLTKYSTGLDNMISKEEHAKLTEYDKNNIGNCSCLTKTPEWKYHEEYCPVWKNGRIGELEGEWKRCFNESTEIIHDLSAENEVLKVKVAEFKKETENFCKVWNQYKDEVTYSGFFMKFKQLLKQ